MNKNNNLFFHATKKKYFYLFIKLITVLYIPLFHLPCFLALDPFPTLNRLQLNS